MYDQDYKIRRLPEIVARSGYAFLHLRSDSSVDMSDLRISYKAGTARSTVLSLPGSPAFLPTPSYVRMRTTVNHRAAGTVKRTVPYKDFCIFFVNWEMATEGARLSHLVSTVRFKMADGVFKTRCVCFRAVDCPSLYPRMGGCPSLFPDRECSDNGECMNDECACDILYNGTACDTPLCPNNCAYPNGKCDRLVKVCKCGAGFKG
uniref:EGF-like domain-containing protein n=1 Tax=Timema douglasi TaxID=61478 RepID=A0A7R8ZGH6_TIMDO|nr:unnamed protein product [Timema douglasi]